MSTFAIYKTKNTILNKVTPANFLAGSGILILPLALASFSVSNKNGVPDYYFFLILGIWLISTIFVLLLYRIQNTKSKQSGDLKITTQGITKSVCGLVKSLNYDTISEINIKAHLKTALFPSNSDASLTYQVTILTKDAQKLRFFASSQSTSSPEINLIKCLHNVPRITGQPLKITT